MAGGMLVYRFGPFELHPATGRLFRGETRVPLSESQSAILVQLVSHAGEIVSADALMRAAWGNTSVAETSLRQAVRRLRLALGDRANGAVYIETLRTLGCRFVGGAQRAERESMTVALDAQIAPHLALVRGRTALESLDAGAIGDARRALEAIVRATPDYADAHVGLAMACGLAFEATAVDAAPDVAALELGIRHARIGCGLAPASGEALSVLAFLLALHGESELAAAAASRAMTLEPDDWRHALRAAYGSWGEERLRAARRVLSLCRGLGLAHWLKATVFIARAAFDAAAEELRCGCAAQDAQVPGTGFPAVGLHLLDGLRLAAHAREREAIAAFRRELDGASSGQLYARECTSNTWYALGAVLLRLGKRDDAQAAFLQALAIAPRHVPAAAAVGRELPASATPIEMATGRAIVLARGNRHAEAARVYREAVAQAPKGQAGWILAVEPSLNPLARPEVWGDALTLMAHRAT